MDGKVEADVGVTDVPGIGCLRVGKDQTGDTCGELSLVLPA